jgi:hypothetical protein
LASLQISVANPTENHQFNLEQTTKVYKTDIDQYFDLLDRFLEGLRATVFSSNSMRCSQRIRQSALDINSTIIGYSKADPKKGYENYVFNMTRVLSNTSAEAVGECYTTTYNLYSYMTIRAA